MRFVSVAGQRDVVHDRAKMEELYSPSLDIWFEDGLETPGIALLKVTPVECEFWEPKHGKIVMAAGMLKALVTKDTPDDTMRHEKISLLTRTLDRSRRIRTQRLSRADRVGDRDRRRARRCGGPTARPGPRRRRGRR